MTEQTNTTLQKEDVTIAILSYITLIGWIIALVMHRQNKTKIGAYHLRQTLGLMLVGVIVGVASFILLFIPFLGWLIMVAACIFLFICWLFGLISAVNGEIKPLPIIGKTIDSVLKNFPG